MKQLYGSTESIEKGDLVKCVTAIVKYIGKGTDKWGNHIVHVIFKGERNTLLFPKGNPTFRRFK